MVINFISLQSRTFIFDLTFLLWPFVIFISIWIPFFIHFFVPQAPITDKLINEARGKPSDKIFKEVYRFFPFEKSSKKNKIIIDAERILRKNFLIPGTSEYVSIPFDGEDLKKGSPSWQLEFASLKIPEILITAYEQTKRDEFLILAKKIIIAFANYERKGWLPVGLIWNDHAIAARIQVLSKFWRYYRNHREYEVHTAKLIFQLVSRSGQFLSSSSHFNYSSNHGLMQNLALLQICISFPTLPNINSFKNLAISRISEQMSYYINDEGIILEHSAEYQRTGLRLLGMTFNYLNIIGSKIPEGWRFKYEKAINFYANLRRPDGSLPKIGDTKINEDLLGPQIAQFNDFGNFEKFALKSNWLPEQPIRLYPIAGYSIWWKGLKHWPNTDNLSQTITLWSNFPGHAHKHADELSVLVWAKGQNWWTNIGYLPYGTKERELATSWNGSNAPHLVGESAKSIRRSFIKFTGITENSSFIDLERIGLEDIKVRRQIIQYNKNLWIVIDGIFGNEKDQFRTIWTTSPNIGLRYLKDKKIFVLEPAKSPWYLKKKIITPKGSKIKILKGSIEPFCGWVLDKPSAAILIEQPVKSAWIVSIWSLEKRDNTIINYLKDAVIENFSSIEDWKINIYFKNETMQVWRNDKRIILKNINNREIYDKINLMKHQSNVKEKQKIATAFNAAAEKYPRKKFYFSKLRKATLLIIICFLLHCLAYLTFSIVGRLKNNLSILRILAFVSWVSIFFWLNFVYLK